MISIFFSPRGTTKRTARAILGYGQKVEERDLLGSPLKEDLVLPPGEPVLVAMPVYAGQIPVLCRRQLKAHLKGSGNPAVAVAVYGNRAYDNALAELQDILEEAGCPVVAAGAFIGRHSIFPKVAEGRPDQADLALMAAFGDKCREKLAAFDPAAHVRLDLPGDHAYREPGRVPFHPSCNDRCMKCYACANTCPAGAIPMETPWITDGEKCISCGACVFLCPTQARQYRGEAYEAAAGAFAAKYSQRREPELFL